MRIALLSDIHGDSIALDAVLADIEVQGGADVYWVLGDLVAFGHDPVGVLERLTRLPNTRFIRGNTDRYVFAGDRPAPSLAEVEENPILLPVLVEVVGTLAWTLGALTVTGWLEWLANLPLAIEDVLPDGTHVLAVHSSPGRDDGAGLAPEMSDEVIAESLQGCNAGLVCVGHTHYIVNRRVGSWHIVNPGTIGNPRPIERRASYALLVAEETGYRVEHRLVDYDREAIIQVLEQHRHPGRAYIIKHLRWLG